MNSLSRSYMWCFAIYCLFITILAIALGSWFNLSWLHRVLRFELYIYCALVLSRKYFDRETFIRQINHVAVLMFCGIIFQYIAYYGLGKYIKLYGNFFPLMTEELYNVDFDSIFSYSAFRPSSFLTEPSHVAQFSIIPFIYNIYLLYESKERKKLLICIMIAMTVLLSKSLWGYLLVIVILGFWLLDTTKKKHSIEWYLTMFLLAIVGFYTVINSKLWSDTFARLDIHNIFGSMAFTGRFAGYDEYFHLPFFRILFGSGFGAVINRSISNSILYILVGEGIIGLMIFIRALIGLFPFFRNQWQRTLCVTFFMLLFGSNIFFSVNLITILSLLFDN